MLRLNNISSPKGANRDTKRIGRGQASGQGTQAGKGHKGQKARNGGGVRIGFEGGSMPIFMRLPKRGFKNALFKKQFAEVSLDEICKKFPDGATVNREILIDSGVLKGARKSLPIKVLSGKEFNKKISFSGIEFFSESAKSAINKFGGSIN